MLVLSHPLRLAVLILAGGAGVTASPWIMYRFGPIGTDTKGFAVAAACLWGENPKTFIKDQRPLPRSEAWDDGHASMVSISSKGECIPDDTHPTSLLVDRLPSNVKMWRVMRPGMHEFAVVSIGVYFDWKHWQVGQQYYGSHRHWATKPSPGHRMYATR